MYREWPSRLDGAMVWTSVVTADTERVLPDGCMDLIWNDGTVFVAGPDTEANLFSGVPGSRLAGLRFAPGVGPTVIGASGHELRDRRVPLDELWPSGAVRLLVDRLADAPDRGAVLEDVAIERLRARRAPPRFVAPTVAMLRQGRGVAAVAEAVGFSDRQLHRRCTDVFGYGPKTLARIFRMRRALDLARAGITFAETAARAGYADQAHLAREVKAFAGVPLGQLMC